MAKGGQQVTTQRLDPATERYQQEVYNRARQASQQPYTPYQGQTVAGASPLSNQAIPLWQQGAQAGGVGINALYSGDYSKFFNPYDQQVLQGVQGDYDQLRNQASLDANDQATRAGAFGGDRHAVMQGARLGQLDQSQASTMAQLRQQGFGAAQNQALQAAQIGLGANQQLFGAGDYFRGVQQQYLMDQQGRFNEARDWQQRNLGILGGFMPGQVGSQTSQPTNRNVASGVAGGALAGSQIAGPYGAVAGGLLGLFG